MRLAPLAMIAAMSRNRVIGHQGRLPWHEPEDLRHFKTTTLGHALIMGRKTFECLGKPLPGRRCIVITRQPAWRPAGVEVVATLAEAIRRARDTDPLPFIGGGGEIYALALPEATRIYLTTVDMDAHGDAFFPALEPTQWRETERRVSGRLLFQTLERAA